jgi:hypothetical protein
MTSAAPNVVFFLHPGALPSFGELQYAVWFARQIQKDGYQPWFVTTHSTALRMRGTNFEPLVFASIAEAKAMIEGIDPAIVIASEIYGLPPESAAMLRTLDVPLGTIDATTMGIEIARDPFLTPDFRSDLTLPEKYFSFRPCPPNDAARDSGTVFHTAGFSGAAKIPRSAARYHKLGLDPARKTVLLPIAPWAQYFADLQDERFLAFRGHYDELIRTVARGLSRTGEAVQLVVISDRRAAQCVEERVSIHTPGLIPFDAYEHLLLSCDLVIADNVVQASIMKAVAAGIPHLVLQNTTAPPYPWNIFPLRQQFPPERDFARVVEVAELSDANDVCEKLVTIFQRGYANARRRVLREDYLGRIAALGTFSQALAKVIGPARPRKLERIRTTGGDDPTIVFYLEIWFSFGEREHALTLARQFQKAGYQIQFVVDRRVADHIRAAGFAAIVFYSPQMGIEAVRQLDPVLIVGCELFNLSEESVRGLMTLGKPMATIDGTSLGIEINTDPFGHPRLTRNLVLPERYWSFRPSPVNDPGPDTSDTFYYNLCSGQQRVAKAENIYGSVGLDPKRKTVMLPIALWATSSASLFNLGAYYALLIDRVVAGLEAYGQPVDLLIIGLPLGASATTVAQGSVRKIYADRLPYGTYNHVLTSCDAIIADNIIQTSVSKAFLMGTPHLVIQNLEKSEVPVRCNIFPLRVLFPAEREYGRSVEVAELGDADGIRAKIVAILTDGHYDAERRDRRQQFLARLAALRDPSEALEQILYESERRRSVAQ